MDIIQQLQRALPSLPKKLALAARYALDFPDQIALNSMRSSAAAVGVTSTTMLRLARHLGFDTYEAFKASFQSQLVSTGFGARAGALQFAQSARIGATLPDRILAASQQNLAVTLSTANLAPLPQVADVIRDAPRCLLMGAGAAYCLAALMKSTGSMILPTLQVVAPELPVAFEDVGPLTGEDVLVCFGVNPCAARTVRELKYASAQGVRTVALTDRPSSPLVAHADYALYAGTDSPHYYPSMAGMVVLIETLLAQVVASGGGREQERIKRIEAQRKASESYIEY